MTEHEDEWVLTYEPATPLYVGLLPHNARRMLQALDAYWLHCDGLPKGRYPRSRSNDEDWWGRFERYRALVEKDLRVADTAETVTAQAGVVGSEPDRDDTHTMGHAQDVTPS